MKNLFLPLFLLVGSLFSQTDGPATLPQATVTVPALSAKGTRVNTATAAGLVQAINSAKCGDTLLVPVGVYTFTSTLVIPCNITIQSAAMASVLPPVGTRITPAYANVASLPGRPAYAGVVKRVIPQFILGPSAKIVAMKGVHFANVEITVIQSSTAFTSGLISGSGMNVILERVYCHGAPNAEVQRCIDFSSGSGAVVDSYLDGFQCKAGGTCSDAQAILMGLGNGGGPVVVRNNFLEASGENILSGGGGATGTQSNITISYNHFFKPLIWMQGDPSFAGVRMMVKNHLEFKNADRVLVEYNTFENCWGGFSQNGYVVVVTPKNQGGNAPGAKVTNLTFRFNNAIGGAGMQIAVAAGDPPLRPSSMGMANISIHDDNFTIDSKFVQSAGVGIQLTFQDSASSFGAISFDRVTVSGTINSAFMFGSTKATGPLSITNSVFAPGQYGSTATGGGAGTCSYQTNGKPNQALTQCWTNFVFSNNAVPGGKPNVWPTGTILGPGVGIGVDQTALANSLKGVQ
jgi:hypothetical protein